MLERKGVFKGLMTPTSRLKSWFEKDPIGQIWNHVYLKKKKSESDDHTTLNKKVSNTNGVGGKTGEEEIDTLEKNA